MAHREHMGRMEGVVMRRYLESLDEELDRLPDRSVIGLLLYGKCGSLRNRLDDIIAGWEVWKAHVPHDVTWDGYDVVRLYETVALDYLDHRNAFVIDRILECDHLETFERDGSVTVEVYNKLGPTATVTFTHEDDMQVVIYEDPEFDVDVTRRLWAYDLTACEPSFK